MIVVDASVWVSRLVPQDVHHLTSRQWLEQYTARGGLCVEPELVLVEVAGVISRRTGEPHLAHQAAATIVRLPVLRFIPLDRRLGLIATRLAADYSLRGADAVYVAAAYHLKIPLVTWDTELQGKTRGLIQALTPMQAET